MDISDNHGDNIRRIALYAVYVYGADDFDAYPAFPRGSKA